MKAWRPQLDKVNETNDWLAYRLFQDIGSLTDDLLIWTKPKSSPTPSASKLLSRSALTAPDDQYYGPADGSGLYVKQGIQLSYKAYVTAQLADLETLLTSAGGKFSQELWQGVKSISNTAAYPPEVQDYIGYLRGRGLGPPTDRVWVATDEYDILREQYERDPIGTIGDVGFAAGLAMAGPAAGTGGPGATSRMYFTQCV